MSVALRPYQVGAIESVRSEIRAGRRKILLNIPTGGGKTLTAASVLAGAVARNRRVLFAAHRKELIDQTCITFGRLGITSIGVIRAQDPRKDLSQPIQIASIQTLVRRDKPPADVVVIDEAHRALAKSYVKHLFEAYPKAVFLGLSATPCRTDGRGLGAAFDALVIGAKYSDLIAEGFICAPVVYGTPVLPDLRKVRTKSGDYNREDLEAAVNRSALIGNCVAEWKKRGEGRKTVVFAVSVAHSKALREAFEADGVRAGHIDGETPEGERADTLARLERGELDLVCNVGVLTEGWDMPSCKCLVIARPTKSLALWMQMAGRILRPWGDASPLILDHGGNVDRHGMPHVDRAWSLEGRMKKSSAAPCKACPVCFCYVPAGLRECPPPCGHVFEVARGEAPDKTEDVVPVELALRTLDGDDAQLAWFRQKTRRAQAYGLKPGWLYHEFVREFGKEPPRAWMKGIREAAKIDPEWRGARKQREGRTDSEAGFS